MAPAKALTPLRLAAAGVVLLAVLLRVPLLGSLPAPAGDETNWLLVAQDAAALGADASFVTTTFARLLGVGLDAFGPGFAAARAVPVILFVAGLVAILVIAFRRQMPWFGIAAAALLAVHPWAVAWNRTAAVPYALCLVLGVLAPLAWVAAADVERPRARAVALVVAAQLWALGLHFSPLAVAVPLACLAWTAFTRPRMLARPELLVAVALAALHAWPIVAAVQEAAQHQPIVDSAIDRERVRQLVEVSLDFVSGESTVRHFTPAGLAGPALVLLRFVTAVVVVASVVVARRSGPALAGAILFGGSLVLLPLALHGARPWWLPGVDADRYGFVLIAPFALLVGGVAQAGRRWSGLAIAALVLFALAPMTRMVPAALRGGGPDTGISVATGGGGWRGWRVTGGYWSPAEVVHDRIAALPPGPVTVILPDWFPFQAVHFLVHNGEREDVRVLHYSQAWTQPGVATPGGVIVMPLFVDSMFGADADRYAHRHVRDVFLATYPDIAERWLVRQPDGRPMFEVFVARVPQLDSAR